MPGKTLRQIGGKPILKHLIDRIVLSGIDWPMIVCTSTLECDDPIYFFCKKEGIECFRGSHLNVASRFYEVSQKHNLDAFLRICADSPMIDGSLVSDFISLWNSGLDLLTNAHPKTYPKGQSLEIINSSFFTKHLRNFDSDSDREHVTSYFYRNLESVRFKNISFTEDLSKHSLAIDTPEDLERFNHFVKTEGESWVHYDFLKILNRYSKHVEG